MLSSSGGWAKAKAAGVVLLEQAYLHASYQLDLEFFASNCKSKMFLLLFYKIPRGESLHRNGLHHGLELGSIKSVSHAENLVVYAQIG